MEIPNAYVEYAASFYPRLPEEVSSQEEFIARGLEFLTSKQFAQLQAFLPHALDGGCTIAELQQAWMSAGPRVCLNDHDLPIFLRITLQVMEILARGGALPKPAPGAWRKVTGS